MRAKLHDKQFQLYNAIERILWHDWDPLVLNQYNDWPANEYESYVPVIFNLKIKGGDAEAIAQKLYEIESKKMGLDGGFVKCKQVAEKIFNL